MANKKRTYARNRAFTRRGNERIVESDGQYMLKLVLVVLLGTLWLKFRDPMMFGAFPLAGIPVGMLFGLLLVHKFEKYQFNRKIWYAILIIVTIICYYMPAGVLI